MGSLSNANSEQNAIALVQQASDRDAVAARWLLYPKSGGLYQRDPVAAGGNILRILTSADLAAPTLTGDLTITKADPSIILNTLTATDTDFWIGVQEDAGGDNDDTLQIGTGTTPGAGTVLTLTAAGALTVTGLTVASDTDASTVLGRALINSRVTDIAYFSHFDQTSNAQYALRQNASGATVLNTTSGQTLSLRTGDTAVVNITNASFAAVQPVTVTVTDAATNALTTVTTLDHESSGTPAAGFGGTLSLLLDSSTTASQLAAGIDWLWQTATHASRAADLVLSAYNVANKREGVRVRGGAAGAELGFYGTTPTARATGYTTFANLSADRTLDANATTLDEVADVLGTLIEDLKLLGLIAA